MDLITTHINADFDCLGSMIAARRLYPGAAMVFPGGQERTLREFFLKSVQYAYDFQKLRDLDLDRVNRLILVDVRQSTRIGVLEKLVRRPGLAVHIYDHHPDSPADLRGEVEHIHAVGATVTVLTRLFMERGIVPSADEATLMMLGLYEDTGSLTFATTTVDAYQAAAYLLEHGANLNTVASMLAHELTPDQIRLLNDLIANRSVLNIQGIDISITHASVDHFVGDIAALAHKLRDIENLDVLLVAVRMESRVFLVARSRRPELNAGEILAEFGGGGHASAAAASVRDLTLLQVLERLPSLLQHHIHPQWQVRHLMSLSVKSVAPRDSLNLAHQLFSRFNINAMPVVDQGLVCGIITRQVADKAIYLNLGAQPVADFMSGEFRVVTPDTPVEELKELIVAGSQRFVPVLHDGQLVGAVTRTDLLRHLAASSGGAPRAAGLGKLPGKQLRRAQVLRLIRGRLPQTVQNLLSSLGAVADRLNVAAFVVGGFVRDLLLNQPNLDVDVVVEGDGIAFAEAFASEHDCRVRCHRKFGTAVIIFPDGFKLDVATARLEYYLHPGALPDVEHASLKLDLYRRDFTVNTLAIALNQSQAGELVDHYGGVRDLEERAIRVLHNLSFIEDPTRMFRAVRFEQRLGFHIGRQTEQLMRSAVRLGVLGRVSGKRLANEMMLILGERDPLPALDRLVAFDLLRALHPGLGKRQDFHEAISEARRVMDWYDLLYTGAPCRRWLCYLMVLTAPLTAEGMTTLCQRLDLPQGDAGLLVGQRATALRLLRRLENRRHNARPPRPVDLHRWLSPLATEVLLALMALASQERVKQWMSRYITHLRSVRPLLGGHDLRRLGIPPGPGYKRILAALLQARLNGEVITADDERCLVTRKYLAQPATDRNGPENSLKS
jgi:tRNA nucleotidyltransferase (CCA-adding enzyme)